MSTEKTTIAVAKGDGIGPEIMDAVLSIFDAAGVQLKYEFVEMGFSVFQKGFSTGMTDEARQSIERTGILFKGPMETPKGKGVKSINVTARKVWNTYANVRKFRTFKGVDTIYSRAGIPINMTVMRENIEDTYGGIEYMHSYDTAVSYRMITRPGSEQFFRYVFEYAKREGASKVTCGHKANIMKLTDGLFMDTFYEVARDYPGIKAEDLIVDDMAMKLVRYPERFEIIALSNLQGDILSDLCAGLVGGLGFAPSANIGDSISIFEAVHGTAPDIAGQKLANPTSLLLSGVLMLRHIGMIEEADRIENALLYSLEQGKHTADFGEKGSPKLSTDEFAAAIIANLGQVPTETAPAKSAGADFHFVKPQAPDKIRTMYTANQPDATLKGMDIYVETRLPANELAEIVTPRLPSKLKLTVISNRGTQVYPVASRYTDSVAQQRVRLELDGDAEKLTQQELFDVCKELSMNLTLADVVFLKNWGDVQGYSLAQGQ